MTLRAWALYLRFRKRGAGGDPPQDSVREGGDMAQQQAPAGMAAWYDALESRDALIRRQQDLIKQLRERLDQYVAAVKKRDEVRIPELKAQVTALTGERDQATGDAGRLRKELGELKAQKPPDAVSEEVHVEIPPPPADA